MTAGWLAKDEARRTYRAEPEGPRERKGTVLRVLVAFHSGTSLLGENGAHKRVVVDLAVGDGEALEELVDLLVRHLLAELGEDVAELTGADEAVACLVEDLEALDELV